MNCSSLILVVMDVGQKKTQWDFMGDSSAKELCGEHFDNIVEALSKKKYMLSTLTSLFAG